MHIVESRMRSLQVNNLLLYPRIRQSIRNSLDNAEMISIVKTKIDFTPKMEEMHKILIELLQACLDEIKGQIKKFENLQSEPDEVLDAEKALLNSF